MKSNSSFEFQEPGSRTLPVHVAIIMDGNGRWAKKRLLNRLRGHERGTETVREIITACRKIGVPVLTLYAFSTENWGRPPAEVSGLMHILKKFLKSEQQEMIENNIRLNAIGEISLLPVDVQAVLAETIDMTRDNTGFLLNLALSYGSRSEICSAAKKIAKQAKAGTLDPDSVDENTLSDLLYTRGIPDPDLLIRTSGEMRISNFLLWQIAYSEISFTDTLWPDFGAEEFEAIIRDYEKRDRRFGKIGK